MIKALLKIRLKQFLRVLAELGVTRILVLLVLIVFIGGILFTYISQSVYVGYISIGFGLLIVSIQLNRKDKIFLKTHFENYKLALFVEYTILSIPIIICLLLYQHWIHTSSLFLAFFVVTNFTFNYEKRTLNTKIQALIPFDAYEWKSGVRRLFFVIIPIWTLGVSTSFFIGSVPIALFLIGISILNFYEKCEPYEMILASETGAKNFLFKKIKLQTILFSILALPLIFLFFLFHTENWYIPIVEFLIFIVLHIYFILTKYAFYEPNIKSMPAQLWSSIGVVAGIVPFLLPVIAILSVRFYIKSIENLNVYLNDYN